MAHHLNDSIILLGHDLLVQKVAYAWSGRKTFIFYLFFAVILPKLPRNNMTDSPKESIPCPMLLLGRDRLILSPRLDRRRVRPNSRHSILHNFIMWSSCARYSFIEGLETAIFTTIAEIFLTIRVYAITGKHNSVLTLSAVYVLCQWGVVLYILSQAPKSNSDPAMLLSRQESGQPVLPTLPNIDSFHICVYIAALNVVPWLQAFVIMCLAFDIVVFLVICITTARAIQRSRHGRTLRIIRRDGLVYFFVLFFSNLVWLLLILHAPPGLKFVQNQSAMLISSIMITRITLNLKRSSRKQSADHGIPWSVKTFEDRNSESLNRSPGIASEESYELSNVQHVPENHAPRI
ncbi:hypothetical protein EVG20_g6258 [Dentipellis fragilis]|uniref:Uncharacterized protein n=1 Tax=Dentipellis fragilis TaxID=205917 RepID=A0A4Y9YM69_9AGAM|nr:hypothetical protein EVG20_g6258 [Dentipellis fragilis]